MSPPTTGEIYVGSEFDSPDADQAFKQTQRENHSMLQQIYWRLAEMRRQGRENRKNFDDLNGAPPDAEEEDTDPDAHT